MSNRVAPVRQSELSDAAAPAEARMPAGAAASYFPSINGLRAICALIVVKEHAGWRLPLPRLFEWGFLGVDMFFVISGFLIVTLLLRERDATRTIDLRSFYVRRTLRIFPIYYLVILLIALVAIATYGHSTRTWELYKWSIPVFLIYAQDLIAVPLGLMFHTWSLAMEEQFYLVWPAVEKYLRSGWVVPLIVVLLGLNQAVNFGWFADAVVGVYGSPAELQRPIFLITFTPILLGVLAAHALHQPATARRLEAAMRSRWTPMWLLLAAIAVCQVSPQIQGLPRLMLHLLFTALLVSLVVTPSNVFSRVLNARPLNELGKISYGLYLYHVFVLAAVERTASAWGWQIPPLPMFLVVLLPSIGIAALSFRCVERPLMSLGRRRAEIARPGDARPAPAV